MRNLPAGISTNRIPIEFVNDAASSCFVGFFAITAGTPAALTTGIAVSGDPPGGHRHRLDYLARLATPHKSPKRLRRLAWRLMPLLALLRHHLPHHVRHLPGHLFTQ